MIHRLLKHVGGHAGKFYVKNPHIAVSHATTAVKIVKMVWTQGPTVAKHSLKFITLVQITI
jgi:hypothetical protein